MWKRGRGGRRDMGVGQTMRSSKERRTLVANATLPVAAAHGVRAGRERYEF